MYSIPLWTLIYSYSKVCLSVFKASNIYCIYCSWALASPVFACSGRLSTISACMPPNNVSRPCNNTAVLSDCMGWWLVVLHFIVSTSHTRKHRHTPHTCTDVVRCCHPSASATSTTSGDNDNTVLYCKRDKNKMILIKNWSNGLNLFSALFFLDIWGSWLTLAPEHVREKTCS